MAEAKLLDVSSRVEREGEAPLLPGDSVQLVVRAVPSDGARVRFPDSEALEQALQGKAIVLDGPSLAESSMGGASAAEATWTVQLLLAPGDHELGPIPVAALSAAGEVGERLDVPGPSVQIGTALPEEVVQKLEAGGQAAGPELIAEQLAPVRGPWTLRGRLPWELGLGIGFGLLLMLGLVAWLVIRWLRNRPVVVAPPRPLPPPEVEARDRLSRLPAMLDAGEHLAFHVELSSILKRYLGRRYDRDLLELTTDEVRRLLQGELKDAPNLPRSREGVLRVLSACDLVKFARDLPQREESIAWLEEVEGIVERTTPAPQPAEAGEEAA